MTALVRPSPPSSGQLLGRVLAQPALVEAVQHLPASALAKLIEHVGLEDAGELIALATTAQLADVFDHDLWRGRPGQAEALDPARFAVWLEVMVEAGAGFAARRLAELPEDLLTHLIHQRALVLELDQLERELAELGDDADYVEKACDDRLHVGLDRLVARGADGWDALAAVLGRRGAPRLARVLEAARPGAARRRRRRADCGVVGRGAAGRRRGRRAGDRRAADGVEPRAAAASCAWPRARTPTRSAPPASTRRPARTSASWRRARCRGRRRPPTRWSRCWWPTGCSTRACWRCRCCRAATTVDRRRPCARRWPTSTTPRCTSGGSPSWCTWPTS
jgi:hypothetical protein